jgi:hypothetical protein
MAACMDAVRKETAMRAQHDDAGDRVVDPGHRIPRSILRRLDSSRPKPQHAIRSTPRLDNELGQDAMPVRAFRGQRVSDSLDADSMNEAPRLNLVPLDSLPRRALHKNEKTACRSETGSYVRTWNMLN